MADLEITLNGVNLPTNTSGTLYVYEDVGNDGGSTGTSPGGFSYDNTNSTSLSSGTTTYTLSGFDASSGNAVRVRYELDNTDVTTTAELTEATSVQSTVQTLAGSVGVSNSLGQEATITGAGTATLSGSVGLVNSLGQEATISPPQILAGSVGVTNSLGQEASISGSGAATLGGSTAQIQSLGQESSISGSGTATLSGSTAQIQSLGQEATLSVPQSQFAVALHFTGESIYVPEILNEPSEFNSITRGETVTLRVLDPPTSVLDYDENAGSYTLTETLQNNQKFRQLIGSSDKELVIGIQFSDPLEDRETVGVWGLIDSITDARNVTLNSGVFELEITVLAEWPDYDSPSAVKTDLEV